MTLIRPTLETLIQRNTQDILARSSAEAPLKHNDAAVYGAVMGATAHSLYGFAQWISQQLFAHSAEGEFLEKHAHYRLGQGKKAASYASGSVSMTGEIGSSLPEQTLLQRVDGAIFVVTQAVNFSQEKMPVAIQAQQAGKHSNTLARTLLQCISPVLNIASQATVTEPGITGGTDEEDDTSLRQRVLAAQAAWPLYGKRGDYVIWAQQVEGITRAWEILHDGAIQRITLLVVNDSSPSITPDALTLQKVHEHIQQVKPLRAEVTISTPKLKPIYFRIRLFPAASQVKAAVEAELRDWIMREAAPGKTLFVSHCRQAISNASGEQDHELIWPTHNLVHEQREMASFGGIEWVV